MTLSLEKIGGRTARYAAYISCMSLCVLSTLDTGLFVYPSLSRYLLLEAGIIMSGFVIVLYSMAAGKRVSASYLSAFIIAWIAYISLHTLFIEPHETYRMLYLAVTLAFVLVSDAGLRTNLLTRRDIENGLFVIAAIHIVFMVAQKLELVASANKHFPIVGSNENPTVTALYFTGVLPILISRTRQSGWHWTYITFAFFVAMGIMLLRCRTAYIGLCIEAAVYVVMRHKETLRKVASRPFRLAVIIIATAIVAVGVGVKMYDMKKSSADGRLLIWKLSAEMVVDRPMGHGYGLFEKNYNLRQAEYFSHGDFTNAERLTADFVYMPYNDYIEQGVEGGVAGMLFLAAFYVLFIRKAVKGGKAREAAVLAAFSVMSLTNFVYSSIQPWLLVMCCAAFVMAGDNTKDNPPQQHSYRVRMADILAFVPLLAAAYLVCGTVKAQLALKSIEGSMQEDSDVPDSSFMAIEKPAATSEAYWRLRALSSMSQDRYDNAIANIRNARLYSSSPELFDIETECLMRQGKTEEGMCILDTMSNMLPHILGLKLSLMRHNAMQGKEREALRYASDILSTGAKYDTEEARKIIQEAKNYKKIYEEKTDNDTVAARHGGHIHPRIGHAGLQGEV